MKINRRKIILPTMMLLLLTAIQASTAAISFAEHYTVTLLYTDIVTGIGGLVTSINNLGQVAGISQSNDKANPNQNVHAVLFAEGKMHYLGSLGIDPSFAFGINNSGQVVGYSITKPRGAAPAAHAALYNNGTVIDLGTLGGNSSRANGINDPGQIVGESLTADGATHAALFVGGKVIDLGTLGGRNSYATSINKSGQVVGSSYLSGNNIHYHAALFANGDVTDLGSLGGSSDAQSINDSGVAVGSADTGKGFHAVEFSGGRVIDLGTLGGDFSTARCINNFGQIVGNSHTASNVTHAMLFENGMITDLNSLIDPNSGWILELATGINDAGQIIGTGKFKGKHSAFLLTPVR
jgi:probable HAF family extracellular repeat protein